MHPSAQLTRQFHLQLILAIIPHDSGAEYSIWVPACRWLAANGNMERAKRAQQLLHGQLSAPDESDRLMMSAGAGAAHGKGTKLGQALKSPVLRYQLHVGVYCCGSKLTSA